MDQIDLLFTATYTCSTIYCTYYSSQFYNMFYMEF